jgi:predicted component of type VI protein secretion system
MPAQLFALDESPSILLDKPILLLGRHPECDVQIDSRKISRRHCCIAQVNDYLVVRDLESTNGVRINGERVVEGRLNPGDELTIGSLRYRVTWDGVPAISAHKSVPRGGSTPRVPPIEMIADDMLESFDEPVPLAEPLARKHVPPTKPKSNRSPDEDSCLLPENIDLMPSSGSCHGMAGNPPQT